MYKKNRKNFIDLCGQWTLLDPVSCKEYPANVPGCNYSDLQNAGVIPDPFVALNEKQTEWVSKQDWVYEKTFDLTREDLFADRIFLNFEKIDTLCDVTLNGEKIASVSNCHIPYSFEVKRFSKEGENKLSLYFHSPVNAVIQKQKRIKCPVNNNGLTGIAHLRKPQCHFGWDWGPVIPVSGIEGDVKLVFSNKGRILQTRVKQTFEDGGVRLRAEIQNEIYGDDTLELYVKLVCPSGETYESAAIAKDKNVVEFFIEKPLLWYANGMTNCHEQPLYTIEKTLLSDDCVLSSSKKQIGLRTITLDRSRDKYGSNFCFYVNGKRVFAKGANWIPTDSYPARTTEKDIEEYVKIARDSGFNMLRVWGGGGYESEYFYDLCDRYGILVWQDFAFACQAYPFFDDEFLQNVKEEVKYVANRLADRACLALWCGNNEIEAMTAGWALRRKFVKWTKTFFYDILPVELKKYDDVTPYIEGSPVGTKFLKNVGSDNVGDVHLWAVWHGFQPLAYYKTRNPRFCSEFGFESMPDLKTIAKFASEADFDLSSEVFSSHQKCRGGNEKMKFYIAERYRLPKRFEDYVYLSQLCQSLCVGEATEHWRATERCNGSLYWQFNDCWPTCSWSGLDYYKNYKAVQYEAKKFFAPFSLAIEKEKNDVKAVVFNDNIAMQKGVLDVKVETFDGKELFSEQIPVEVEGCSTCVAKQYDVRKFGGKKALKNAVFVATLTCENPQNVAECQPETIRKTMLFGKEKNLKLPKANVTVDVHREGNKAIYTIKSDVFVRKFALFTKQNSPLSDNYFDVLPNETVRISQTMDEGCALEVLKNDFEFKHVAAIAPKSSKFADSFFRFKTLLSTWNLLNYVWYKFFM